MNVVNSGLYGTVRAAVIKPSDDVDIQYSYRASAGEEVSKFSYLNPSCLVPVSGENAEQSSTLLNGLFNLRLPLDKFSEKGLYSIYIRPKELETSIFDIGVLAADPSIVGLVFNVNNLGFSSGDDVDLTGYRIEYYGPDGDILDMARIITTCSRCEQIRVSLNDSSSPTLRYNLLSNDSSSLIFCTITPSSASSYKPNSRPSFGSAGQIVRIVNTKFNPVLIELELVENDADTITTLLKGDQIRDLDNAIITTYNENKEIFAQAEYSTLKSANGTPLYDVKKNLTNIDKSQEYSSIITE